MPGCALPEMESSKNKLRQLFGSQMQAGEQGAISPRFKSLHGGGDSVLAFRCLRLFTFAQSRGQCIV